MYRGTHRISIVLSRVHQDFHDKPRESDGIRYQPEQSAVLWVLSVRFIHTEIVLC